MNLDSQGFFPGREAEGKPGLGSQAGGAGPYQGPAVARREAGLWNQTAGDEAAPRALSVVAVAVTDGRQRRSAVRGHKDCQGSAGKHRKERFQSANHGNLELCNSCGLEGARVCVLGPAQPSQPEVGLTPRPDLDPDFPGHPLTPFHPPSFWGPVLLLSQGRMGSPPVLLVPSDATEQPVTWVRRDPVRAGNVTQEGRSCIALSQPGPSFGSLQARGPPPNCVCLAAHKPRSAPCTCSTGADRGQDLSYRGPHPGMHWVPARPPAVRISAFLGPPLGVTPSSLSALSRDPCFGSHPAWQEEQAATLKLPDPSPATSSLSLWKGMCALGFTMSLCSVGSSPAGCPRPSPWTLGL